MSVSSTLRDDHVRVITMDAPPVNALTVQGWFDVAAALDEASADVDTHVVVLRAEGRGFNAGVDIKEMQNTTGFDALIGANKGCYAAFKAVYECSVPVIAAVNGFCLGGTSCRAPCSTPAWSSTPSPPARCSSAAACAGWRCVTTTSCWTARCPPVSSWAPTARTRCCGRTCSATSVSRGPLAIRGYARPRRTAPGTR